MTAARSRHASDKPERALRIEDGRVICPRQGRVDIARCWQCPDYVGLSTGHIEDLVCGASFKSIDGRAQAARDQAAADAE